MPKKYQIAIVGNSSYAQRMIKELLKRSDITPRSLIFIDMGKKSNITFFSSKKIMISNDLSDIVKASLVFYTSPLDELFIIEKKLKKIPLPKMEYVDV